MMNTPHTPPAFSVSLEDAQTIADARALIERLEKLARDVSYAGATIGNTARHAGYLEGKLNSAASSLADLLIGAQVYASAGWDANDEMRAARDRLEQRDDIAATIAGLAS